MTGKVVATLLARSKLLSEPESTYAQHTGESVALTADENGSLWVNISVSNGDGTSGTPLALQTAVDSLDNEPNFSAPGAVSGGLAVINHAYAFDGGATWDRSRTGSAANVGATSGTGATLTAPVGEWGQTSAPVAATQATTSKAAVAAVRHVCKGVSFTFNAVNAEAGTHLVNLRDGASGGGTILQSWRVGPFAALGSVIHSITDLNLIGTVNTAMTLEFDAAGAVGNFESVAMRGYDAT